jgi:hypothetical protein
MEPGSMTAGGDSPPISAIAIGRLPGMDDDRPEAEGDDNGPVIDIPADLGNGLPEAPTMRSLMQGPPADRVKFAKLFMPIGIGRSMSDVKPFVPIGIGRSMSDVKAFKMPPDPTYDVLDASRETNRYLAEMLDAARTDARTARFHTWIAIGIAAAIGIAQIVLTIILRNPS